MDDNVVGMIVVNQKGSSEGTSTNAFSTLKVEVNKEVNTIKKMDENFIEIVDEAVEAPKLLKEKKAPTNPYYKQWNYNGKNLYVPTGATVSTVPPSTYVVGYDNKTGFYLCKINVFSDDLLNLPIPEIDEITNDLNDFWQIKSKFDKYGFIYKRGILIHGPQGTGKTCIVHRVAQNVINNYN